MTTTTNACALIAEMEAWTFKDPFWQQVYVSVATQVVSAIPESGRSFGHMRDSLVVWGPKQDPYTAKHAGFLCAEIDRRESERTQNAPA